MSQRPASVLAIITARAGSKGVRGKNLRLLDGKPLLSWTVEAARHARSVARTIVSTDSLDIAETAIAAGAEVPFIRPPELATDLASSADVVTHALAECPGYDFFVLLQPTSPLRTGADIDAAFTMMQRAEAEACVSVSEVETSPWLMFRREDTGQLKRLLPPWPGGMRRQDLPKTYVLNGAIYIVSVETFLKNGQLPPNDAVGFALPPDRAIDIDTYADFRRAEAALALLN